MSIGEPYFDKQMLEKQANLIKCVQEHLGCGNFDLERWDRFRNSYFEWMNWINSRESLTLDLASSYERVRKTYQKYKNIAAEMKGILDWEEKKSQTP